MRLLDYSIPLSGEDTDIKLHLLLDKITQVMWDSIPLINSSRSLTKRRPLFSPGLNHSAADDSVWFNDWTSSFCSSTEPQLSRLHSKQIAISETVPHRRAETYPLDPQHLQRESPFNSVPS